MFLHVIDYNKAAIGLYRRNSYRCLSLLQARGAPACSGAAAMLAGACVPHAAVAATPPRAHAACTPARSPLRRHAQDFYCIPPTGRQPVPGRSHYNAYLFLLDLQPMHALPAPHGHHQQQLGHHAALCVAASPHKQQFGEAAGGGWGWGGWGGGLVDRAITPVLQATTTCVAWWSERCVSAARATHRFAGSAARACRTHKHDFAACHCRPQQPSEGSGAQPQASTSTSREQAASLWPPVMAPWHEAPPPPPPQPQHHQYHQQHHQHHHRAHNRPTLFQWLMGPHGHKPH